MPPLSPSNLLTRFIVSCWQKKKNSTYCIVLQKTPLFSGSWPCLGTFQYPSEGCALWSIHREKLLLQWEGEGGIEQGEREARGCRDVIFRNVIDIRLILYVLSLWSRRYFRPRSNKKERKKKKKNHACSCVQDVSVHCRFSPPPPSVLFMLASHREPPETGPRSGAAHLSFYGIGSVSLLLPHTHTHTHGHAHIGTHKAFSKTCTSAVSLCS